MMLPLAADGLFVAPFLFRFHKFVDGRLAQIAIAVDLDSVQRAFQIRERRG